MFTSFNSIRAQNKKNNIYKPIFTAAMEAAMTLLPVYWKRGFSIDVHKFAISSSFAYHIQDWKYITCVYFVSICYKSEQNTIFVFQCTFHLC